MKRCFTLILAAALCLTGCGKQAKEASAQIFAMDTVMEVAIDTFFRIEYLCFGNFPFVVKEKNSNAPAEQEEYLVLFRVQVAMRAEVSSRF